MALTPARYRPFVAAVLGMLVTGLGHVYLRRWLRAAAWLATAFAVSVAFVPETTAAAILAGETVDPMLLLPGAAVGFGSALDAFLIARRQVSAGGEVSTGGDAVTSDGPATNDVEPSTDENVDCPNCGKPVDPELAFCHWCTTEFDDADLN
jgi:hypothetical protein